MNRNLQGKKENKYAKNPSKSNTTANHQHPTTTPNYHPSNNTKISAAVSHRPKNQIWGSKNKEKKRNEIVRRGSFQLTRSARLKQRQAAEKPDCLRSAEIKAAASSGGEISNDSS